MTERKWYEQKINPFILCAVIFLAFVSAFRLLGQGADWAQYQKIFSDSSISVEPGFALFRKLAVHAGGAAFVFFVFTVIALSFIYKTIRMYSEYPVWAFLFYVLTFYLLHEYTQIRAATAISIFFLSINDLRDRNFKLYLLKTLIATCFHYSSAVMLLLYFFCKMRSPKKYLMIPCFLFIADFILIYILNKRFTMVSFLAWLSEKQDNSIFAIIRMKISARGEELTLFNMQYISFLFCLGVMYLVCIKRRVHNYNELVIFKILSFSLCSFFLLLPTGLTVLVFRIPEFYSPVMIISMTMIVRRMKEKQMALQVGFLYIAMFSAMLVSKIGIL